MRRGSEKDSGRLAKSPLPLPIKGGRFPSQGRPSNFLVWHAQAQSRMESMAAARPEGTAATAAVTPAREVPLESRRPASTRLLARLRKDERGIALMMALGIMSVFCTVGATIVTYSTSGARSSSYSAVSTRAATLAEGGLNNALATVFKPGTNPANPYLFCSPGEALPCAPRTAIYDGETVSWTGTLNQAVSPAVW